jgi:NADH-quinone oxidoreductase subunit A
MIIDNIIVIGAVIVISLVMDGAILILTKILPKYNITEIKESRFEAGNLPIRNPKHRIPMQYFGYMYMFMAIEPVLVLLLLFAAYPSLDFYMLLGISAILFIPAVFFGYKLTLSMAYGREAYE